ncbi:MAG TPA: twin-arginine translocase subunit TatC [Spirochaetales bacterium]|nr:twin-arginine translocase subunit TatC [Spirochaetales bacterium]HRY54913.1 twin-arginine translocase subunit TatC [Spirochaetia bacterium]HRZ63500.1 twin-arginine translocase subunit TatC [Spirochaetia bacterium]
MSLLGHLAELRRRLLVSLAAFAACFVLALLRYGDLLGLLTALFRGVESQARAKLFASSLPEGFLVQLQLAAAAAFLLSLPLHLVSLAQFLLPALGRRQRGVLAAGILASFLLACLGVFMSYFHILPWSIRFFAGSAFMPSEVGMLLNLRQSVAYVLSFTLWAVLTFQSPLLLLILLSLRILDRRSVFRSSRFVIVIIFLLSAIITPSVDPFSQCAIALPLVALFFLALLIARIFRLGEGAAVPAGGGS